MRTQEKPRASKPPEKIRAPKRAIQREEKISLALERFRPLGAGNDPTSIADLSRRYGRDPSVISKSIRAAFKEDLVRIVRVEDGGDHLPRCGDCERQLAERFHLSTAIVVDTSSETRSETNDRKRSDRVHQILGAHMARLIATGSVFRGDDAIAVGPGRAVYYLVEWLRKRKVALNADVSLLSLAGSNGAANYSVTKEPKFFADSDTLINNLSDCFSHGAGLKRIGYNICDENDDEVNSRRQNTWLANDALKRKLTHALLGVGALVPGHKFYDAIRSRPDKRLSRIHDVLAKLVNLCDDLEKSVPEPHRRFYCPVGDLANRFLVTDAPPGIDLDQQEIARLTQLVDTVNSRLLTLRLDELEIVKNLMVVCGTPKKAAMLRTVLTATRERSARKKYNVKFLCIDQETAEWIIQNP